MAPDFDHDTIRQLPLIPEEILRRHRVHEAYDHRFRAAARLLQALWREDRDLPIGTHVSTSGTRRKLGSLISASAAKAGRNFLSAQVAHLAKRECAYRETGAYIDQERLFTNLLSSLRQSETLRNHIHRLTSPVRLGHVPRHGSRVDEASIRQRQQLNY